MASQWGLEAGVGTYFKYRNTVLSLTASAFAISGIISPCFLSCRARGGFGLDRTVD